MSWEELKAALNRAEEAREKTKVLGTGYLDAEKAEVVAARVLWEWRKELMETVEMGEELEAAVREYQGAVEEWLGIPQRVARGGRDAERLSAARGKLEEALGKWASRRGEMG